MATPYQIAAGVAGTHEGQAALTDFLRTGGQNIDPTTRAWCADFVNATLAKAGQKGTDSGMARSFLQWGQEVAQPEVGDIAVFSRGDPNGPSGHVGFFAGQNPDGTIKVLGGNQSDSVSYANYPADRLLGYRRPGDTASPSAPTAQPDAPMGSLAGMGQTSSVPTDVASYATSKEPKSLGDRLTAASKMMGAFTPDPPRISGGMGDARNTGNVLLKQLQSPTLADILRQKRA